MCSSSEDISEEKGPLGALFYLNGHAQDSAFRLTDDADRANGLGGLTLLEFLFGLRLAMDIGVGLDIVTAKIIGGLFPAGTTA